MELKIDGKRIDLPKGFRIDIEDTNPIFNDIGSQSIPVTLPPTDRNMMVLKGAHRVDSATEWHGSQVTAEIADGPYRRSGLANLTSAGRSEGYELNIGFDNSMAYAKWKGKKLCDLSNLPVYTPILDDGAEDLTSRVAALADIMKAIYEGRRPSLDFAVYQVAVKKSEGGATEWLNATFSWTTRITEYTIDGALTEVRLPGGYGITPMLKVTKILELIFGDLGLEVKGNITSGTDLDLLTVLNNCADAICTGHLHYRDLMPDVTVSEFLNALWVRFGLTYHIDFDRREVMLRLLKDIIADSNIQSDLAETLQKHPRIAYLTPEYVKLSASTSLDGAEPLTERFEDFVKGCDLTNIRHGENIALWKNTGTPQQPTWDFDEYPDPEDPYDPDPPDGPEPDDWDDPDWDYATGGSQGSSDTQAGRNSLLAREYVDGDWYMLDASNSTVRKRSSPFFAWDPQPDGMDPMELQSVDEFVPVIAFGSLRQFFPFYSVGMRHYHTYVKTSDGEVSETDAQTPLAFMFAYTITETNALGHDSTRTIGRLGPEGEDGRSLTLANGRVPSTSLLFQFKGGLFDKFWADYDHILRHGNREIESMCVMPPSRLRGLITWRPIALRGVTCLVNTVEYSLPCAAMTAADITLRTLLMRGNPGDDEGYTLIALPSRESDENTASE